MNNPVSDTPVSTLSDPQDIASAWERLLADEPRLRIRNAAARLNLTEVQLLATRCGEGVTRLRPLFKEILARVVGLGYVMALTRNEEVVHERKGVYENGSLKHPAVGLFVNEDIDLRIFWQDWAAAFAVVDEARGQVRRSLQFFDIYGQAIHKIYLTPQSDLNTWETLVSHFKAVDQEKKQDVIPAAEPKADLPEEQIDVPGFQKAWIELEDTHDFFGLLKEFEVGRLQAMKLAPKGYATRLSNGAFRAAVELAAEDQTPIMVFVGNNSMIQIHTGPVKRLLDHESWFNVMDPAFNLHLNEAGIASSWLVRKPTRDGMVSSLEVYNEQGELIVQLFGKRKPGIPELPEWRVILEKVERQHGKA